MRYINIFILQILLSAPSFLLAGNPSFDCRKASEPDEFTICSSNELSELDRIISAAYGYFKSLQGTSYARSVGAPLLKLRQTCGADFDCIKNAQIIAINSYSNHGVPVSVPDWITSSANQDMFARIAENERIAKTANYSCAPKGFGSRTLFVDPNITSDFWTDGIGLSWSLIIHSVEKIAGIDYYRGHLISPRGGHQPEVGYVIASEWNCYERRN